MESSDAEPAQSIVLEEEIDENYEPTDEEVREYAQWLGMDLENERALMWIASEGLKAPLPEDWKPCRSPEGDIYYINFSTGESVWDHPCDEYYRTLYQEEKRKLERKRVEDKPVSLAATLSACEVIVEKKTEPPKIYLAKSTVFAISSCYRVFFYISP